MRIPTFGRRTLLAATIVATVLTTAPSAALAQAWPAKPIRVLIGFPPGTLPDTIARLLAEKMVPNLGQPMVIENRPGAAATIAANLAAQAPADGYTIMVGLAASMSVGPWLFPSAKYHPVKDFEPIGLIQRGPYYIAVRTDLPINSFQDLIAYGKARPGELNYASPGIGTQHHLTWELIQMQTGARFVHVPQSGTAQAITETLGGRTQVIMDGAGLQFAAQVKAGKLRMIAMTGTATQPAFPGVIPVAEQGMPGMQSHSWWGLVAPAGTPRDIINRLNAELNKALASPDIIERLSQEGSITTGKITTTPEEFGRWIAAEYERWGKVIKDAGIKLQ